MRLSHLNSLRALEATLRNGSFTAAASELGITSAAVGQRVRTLEGFVGKTLFKRSGAGIQPAEDALRVSTMLTGGFTTIASALERLKTDKTGTRISLTLPASFAENWFTPMISDFFQRHGEVELRLDASNRDVDLISEGFDFAIRYGRPVSEPLQETVLFGDYVLPACCPEFAEQYKLDAGTRSLKGVPLIHLLNRTGDPGWVGFEGWGERFGFDPAHFSQGMSYSRISSGLRTAITGQGLVLCGLTEAFNEISSGRLVIPFGPAMHVPTSYAYRLVWVRGMEKTQLQDDFIAWLMEKVSDFRNETDALLGM
ncbi:MAG: LysR family transcriptional regulator [Rhodospirillaceae bacterium]|nr:LysR family transcriptional regulator [Rhodospirillaceae bacterium]